MSGSVARECISSTLMREIMCIRQLEPACLKVLFQCEQLKAEYSEIKCQFLMLKEFLKVSRLPLFGRVWSFKLERFSFDSVQTDIQSHIMTCASSVIYVFKKYGLSTEERLYSLVLCVCPSPDEFALTGLKGQGLASSLMRKEE